MISSGMTYKVTIPDWHPPLLNQLLRQHWGKRHRTKKAAYEIVHCYCRMAAVPVATCKRRVSLVITLSPKQRRPPDPDGFWKVLLDALVECGRLCDDGPKHCECGTVEYNRGDQQETVIVIEDTQTK